MNTGRGISGAANTLMNAASLAAGREIHGVVSDVLWFTVGFAIGGTPGVLLVVDMVHWLQELEFLYLES